MKELVTCALYKKVQDFKTDLADFFKLEYGLPRFRTESSRSSVSAQCNWKLSLPNDLFATHDSELYQYVIHQTYGQ